MEIKIANSCYSRSIRWDGNVVISGMTSSDNADENVNKLTHLSILLVNHYLSEHDLKYQWEMEFVDWDFQGEVLYPPIEKIKYDIIESIKKNSENKEKASHVFSTTFDLIESLPAVSEESSYCEGCCDTNYSKIIVLLDKKN